MQASVHDSDHYNVDRIFVGLSSELHCWWQLDRVFEQWQSMEGKSAQNSTTDVSFWTTLYVWVNAWRQSWWCSQNLCRPFLYLFNYLINCITRHNFSPTRSVITLHCVAQFSPTRSSSVIYITWNNFSLPGCNSKKDWVLFFYYLMHAHCEWYVPHTYASSTMSQHQKSLEVPARIHWKTNLPSACS